MLLLVFLEIGLLLGASAGAQETRTKAQLSIDLGGPDPAMQLPVLNRPFPFLPTTTPQPPTPQPPPRPDPHAFWDAKNHVLFAGVGVFRGLDFASTPNMQARGRE